MGQTPRSGLVQQLPLLLEASRTKAVSLPEAIEADLIDALATILLEAAGVATEATEGGLDESEDHA